MKKTNYYLIAILSYLILFSISCSKDKQKVVLEEKPVEVIDKENPKITLLSTSDYVTKAGSIKIIANVADNIGVTKVEFFSGTNLIGTDMEAPFELPRDYSTTAYGDEYYNAYAYDAAGNKSKSENIKIRVNVERTTPILEISLPKTIFKTNDNSIVPLAILKGAPYQSGTLDLTKLGANCTGTPSYNKKAFSDGVMPSTFQFNNGVAGNYSISARILLAGKPEIISNCVNYTITN